MRKTIMSVTAAGTIAVLTIGAASAQSSDGEVRKIDESAGKITLKHGPIKALDMTDDPVLLFRSAGTEQLNIVYRRNDGNIGWIDAANIKG